MARRAAGCRARRCGSPHRDGAGRTPAIACSTSLTGEDAPGCANGGPVTSQGEQRKAIAIEVVTDHESGGQLAALGDACAALFADAVAREPASGERLLV